MVVAVLLAVAGCGDGPEERAGPATGPTEVPERRGEPVSLRRVGQLELFVQDSVEGPCLGVRDSEDSTEGCGFEVPERHSVGHVVHEASVDGPAAVAGIVVPDASQVRLELVDGTAVDLEPVDASGFAMRFFVAEIDDPAALAAVVALGPSGEEIERRPTDAPDDGG